MTMQPIPTVMVTQHPDSAKKYVSIQEEVDELWEAIKRNHPSTVIMNEAIQVSAVAMRLAEEIAGGNNQ